MRESIKFEENLIMGEVSRLERRGSETDTTIFPVSDNLVDWREFNSDIYSTELSYDIVAQICETNTE